MQKRSAPRRHPRLSTPKAGGYTVLDALGTRELFATDPAGSWQPGDISWEEICEVLDFRLANAVIGGFARSTCRSAEKVCMQVFARRVDVARMSLLLLTCSEPWHCAFGEPSLTGDIV